MKTTNKNNKSKLLALLLSVMMFSSMGAAFASCADDTDSSSSSSSSSSVETEDTANDRVDNGTIKNSHFDFTTLSETVKIGTSVTGWSRSVNSATTGSAPSSSAASGVIDVSEDAWNDLTTRKKTDEQIADMEIKDFVDALNADKNALTTADKLAFYEDWKDRDKNDDLDIDEEFEEYQEDSYESFNIDADDLPALGMENPGMPDEDKQATTDDKGNERDVDNQILMIHNYNKSTGTAQKFTSSTSVTVSAGTAAKFSIWVKTADLKTVNSNKEEQDAVGKGAYISITQSVGGKTLDSYEVKNIETDEWKEYTFYLKGSSFADTKFSIVLGLGKSGGTDHLEYVNGYAFFDNIQYEEIDHTEYEAGANSLDDRDSEETFLESDKLYKTVDAYEDDRTTFAMNFYDRESGESNNGWIGITETNNEFFVGSNEIDNLEDAKTTSPKGATINNDLFAEGKAYDKLNIYANRAAIEEDINGLPAGTPAYLSTIYENFIKDTDTDNNYLTSLGDPEILMMLSSKGTAYKWDKAYEFKMPANVSYMALSFFVKTSDFEEGTGLTITLVDEDETNNSELNSTSFSSINTADLAGVTIDGVEDYYDGWQRYYFFIEKDKELENTEQKFYLTLNYGPLDITVDTAKTSFAPGFAALTNFETLSMSPIEYQCAQTGTYAQKYTLVPGEEDKAAGNTGFDTAAGTPSDALENGFADPQNFKGVYSDSYYVDTSYSGKIDVEDPRRLVNQHENAGLLNREYFADIVEKYLENGQWSTETPAWLRSIAGSSKNANDIWNSVFGNATQPLLIWNNNDTAIKDDDGNITGYEYSKKPYGYIGSSTTISSTHTAISIRVKTGGGATASVYLVDMDDETRQSYLSVSNQITYWYDDNGNILTNDPDSDDSVIAFRLNKKTGLYTADKKWAHYNDYKDQVFANLSAYTEGVDADGNTVLFAAENSATHSYHDYTWDRAVYYKLSDGYYTAKENGTKVTDLKSVVDADKLELRFDGTSSANLAIENIDTDGKWATVTFYIKKGNESKNYRLEVWSGTRTSKTMNFDAGSYVIFDTNNPGTASELYDSLMEEYKDTATEKFESVFSYYDTDKHVRYEKALDVDEVGNLYDESFTQSSYEQAIAYMLHETKLDPEDSESVTLYYNIFADYSLSDVSITPRAAETEDEETDTDTETETDEDDTNIFLLISSIAVSAALVVAIGGIATQRIIKFVKKRKAAKARVNVVKKNK